MGTITRDEMLEKDRKKFEEKLWSEPSLAYHTLTERVNFLIGFESELIESFEKEAKRARLQYGNVKVAITSKRPLSSLLLKIRRLSHVQVAQFSYSPIGNSYELTLNGVSVVSKKYELNLVPEAGRQLPNLEEILRNIFIPEIAAARLKYDSPFESLQHKLLMYAHLFEPPHAKGYKYLCEYRDDNSVDLATTVTLNGITPIRIPNPMFIEEVKKAVTQEIILLTDYRYI